MKSTIKSYDLVEWPATGSNAGSLRDDLARMRRAITAKLALWQMRSQTRRELAWMNEGQLKDLGISGIDAHREAKKPFWQP